ncbi:MAG: 1-acyl-sn-glycerol-3-phosphate acyltransferase [Clostridia bacterium]|nr:1-acyl-sn-glycerol-3-phosphate acyltransferase [Clostridia bacterium]
MILYNHQTSFDQFFVGMCFKGPVYYVASEDIFSSRFLAALLSFLVAPIPINKAQADLRAIINCMKVASEGGTIAIAPEGNRTYSGRTCYIKPSVAMLIRKLKLPLAFFRIEDGYGVQPRWSNVNRKGSMAAGVSRVVEPEEYGKLSDDELYKLICDELNVDEAKVSGEFRHKRSAEYLERLIYVCPFCGLSEFRSSGKHFSCLKCGLDAEYLPTKELKFDREVKDIRFVADWYGKQEAYINSIDTDKLTNPLYKDTVRLFDVIIARYKRKITDKAVLTMYGDRIEIDVPGGDGMVLDYGSIGSVTALGKNKMNIRSGGRILQIKGSVRFNPVKYMNIYYRYRNTHEGDNKTNGYQFLGL